jgi:DNA-binding winged helix-turn-helix (wHTH) protein
MFQIGDWLFHPKERLLTRDGQAKRLSPRASRVLSLLARAQGEVLSRSELLDAAWSGMIVVEESLTHAIGEIRRALDDNSRQHRFIETLYGAGYRICTDVSYMPGQTGEALRPPYPLGFEPILTMFVSGDGRVRPGTSGALSDADITRFGGMVITYMPEALGLQIDLDRATAQVITVLKLELDACRTSVVLRYCQNDAWDTKQFGPFDPARPSLVAQRVAGFVALARSPGVESWMFNEYLDIGHACRHFTRLGVVPKLIHEWAANGRQVDLRVMRAMLGVELPESITLARRTGEIVVKDIDNMPISPVERRARLGKPVARAIVSKCMANFISKDHANRGLSERPFLGRALHLLMPELGPIQYARYRLVLPNTDDTTTTFSIPMPFGELADDRMSRIIH